MAQWSGHPDLWCEVVQYCGEAQHYVLWFVCRAARYAVERWVRRAMWRVHAGQLAIYREDIMSRSGLLLSRRNQSLFEAERRYRRDCVMIKHMSVPELLLYHQDPMPCISAFIKDLTPAMIDWLTPAFLASFVHGSIPRVEITLAFSTFLDPARSSRTDEECSAVIARLQKENILSWVDRTGSGFYDPAMAIVVSGRLAVFQRTVPLHLWTGRSSLRLRLNLVYTALDRGHAHVLAYLLDGPDPSHYLDLTNHAAKMIKRALDASHYECAKIVVSRLADQKDFVIEQLWRLYHQIEEQYGITISRPEGGGSTLIGAALGLARRRMDLQFAFALLHHFGEEEETGKENCINHHLLPRHDRDDYLVGALPPVR